MRKIIFISIFFSAAFFINYLHEYYFEKKMEKNTKTEKNMQHFFIKDPYQDLERDTLPKIMTMSEEQKIYTIEIFESIFKIIHENSTLENEEKLYGEGHFFWPKNPHKPTEITRYYDALKVTGIKLQFDRQEKSLPWNNIYFSIKPKNFPKSVYSFDLQKDFFSKLTLIECARQENLENEIKIINIYKYYSKENDKIKFTFYASTDVSNVQDEFPRSFHDVKIENSN